MFDGWTTPVFTAVIAVALWCVYDATTLYESKDSRYANGVAAFNTFMKAGERVAQKTGDKRSRSLVNIADYYTSVHVAADNFEAVIRRRWIGSTFILVGFLQKGDVVKQELRDTVALSQALGIMGKGSAIFIHENAARAKPSYLRGMLFLHAMNDAVRHGGTFASYLMRKESMADEVSSMQEMLNLAALIGGSQYTKAVEDAVVYSNAGIKEELIVATFHNEVAAILEAETFEERYAVNQLFTVHIAFRKAEVQFKDDPDRVIAEKYEVMTKIIRFLNAGKSKQV